MNTVDIWIVEAPQIAITHDCEFQLFNLSELPAQWLRSNRRGYQLLLRRRYWGSFEMLNQP
jgi:hypothetical protein